MGFAIDARQIPNLRSFKDCEDLANKRRMHLRSHQRGRQEWSAHKLPLCHNKGRWSNQEHKRMVFDDDLKAWNLILFRSTVVRYYKDGRVLLNASWDSISTRIFFHELCPHGVWLKKTSWGWAYCIGHAGNQWDVKTYSDDVEWHQVNRPMHHGFAGLNQGLLIDEQGVVLNPLPWTTKRKVSNKEQRKVIREKLKPFTTWFDAMTTVGNTIRGVIVGAEEMNAGNKMAEFNRTAVTYMLDRTMGADPEYDKMYENEDPEYTQSMWRRACWTALFNAGASPWYWNSMADDNKYSFGFAAGIKRYILETALKLHDGYKDITVVTPPGEKP
jgi:hypothetical protein